MSVIGLFDSGLGGLSVARAILALRPDVSVWVVGDTAHVPYGGRPLDEVRGFALGLTRYLAGGGADAVVMACNISSAVALDAARTRFDIPIFGTVDAGARAASAVADGIVGVLATEGTVNTRAYTKAIKARRPDLDVLEVPCPAFVPLVESGRWASPEASDAAREYAAPLVNAGVRTVVLGCTHYPFLEAAIRSAFPWPVRLVDPAQTLAEDVLRAVSPTSPPSHRFEATADPAGFASRGSLLLGFDFQAVACPVWASSSSEAGRRGPGCQTVENRA